MREMRISRNWYENDFSTTFKLGRTRTKRLIADLVERGLIERIKPGMKSREGHWNETVERKATYRITDAGHRLATKSMLKRIPRAKAEQIVAELIERAKAINARPELMMGVLEIIAFGSYIRKCPTLGDIDVAVTYYRKGRGEMRVRWHDERVRATAPYWIARNVFNGWGETEVRRLLRASNRYLQMTDDHVFKEEHMRRVRRRVIFSAKPEDIAVPAWCTRR